MKRQLEQKLTMTRLLGTAPLKRIAPASCVRLYSNGEGNIQESFGTPATHECSINSAVTAIEQFSCPEAELERPFCYQWVNILFPPIGRPTIVPQAWEADWRTRLIISLSKQGMGRRTQSCQAVRLQAGTCSRSGVTRPCRSSLSVPRTDRLLC